MSHGFINSLKASMEIRRVFVDKLKMRNGLVLLAGPVHKYIYSVLRKTAGDRIDLIDGKGYLYRCTINNIKNKELFLQVLDVVHRPEEKRPKVTLCVSPIKGPRMDWLVEKATELGVERILPTVFKRTIIKIEDNEKVKLERWKKLAIEASRQSGRFTIPEVIKPTPLRGILSHIEGIDNRWALYEREKKTAIKDVITSQKENGICVVIGPEGGIEESEIKWLIENNFTSCTLGENIFRAETTPLVILSIILYEYSKK
jgi:16S rRNA (uracil1498-N3)-methyltransferase